MVLTVGLDLPLRGSLTLRLVVLVVAVPLCKPSNRPGEGRQYAKSIARTIEDVLDVLLEQEEVRDKEEQEEEEAGFCKDDDDNGDDDSDVADEEDGDLVEEDEEETEAEVEGLLDISIEEC